MIKRTVLAGAVALGIVGITLPRASAVCNPPKFASTYNPGSGAYVYWTTSITDPSATLVGRIWSDAKDYTGSCNDGQQTFFYFGATPGTIGLSISLGTACVPPGMCPSGDLNAKAWVMSPNGVTQETGVRHARETPAGGVNFDFSDSAVPMVAMSRPRAQSAFRAGGAVHITTYPAPIPGDAASLSTVTGCNIRSVSSNIHPGWLATAYPIVAATVPASGGTCPATTVSVECLSSTQEWLVYQIVTDAGPDPYVGPATRINCNPALAEPKNKITPKKNAVSVRH